MQKKFLVSAMFFLAIFCLAITTSCARKTSNIPKMAMSGMQPSDEECKKAKAAPPEAPKDVLVDIYFEFDSSALTSQAEAALKINTKWLENNPGAKVTVEGHCDERGTNEYNLALGDRRAQSTKKYLLDMGIKESRISTISYGEEKPADPGHDEAAWAKNRRAHFVVD